MAALDQAFKENYLGDPKVVSKLLSDFSAEALRRRASGMDVEEAGICDNGHALALAEIPFKPVCSGRGWPGCYLKDPAKSDD
jgi:hypothetical protein